MSERRLLHYTLAPLEAVRSVEQDNSYRHDKPRGLWVSVEGDMDWREWCEAEDFGDIDAQRCYEITLAPGARILRLATVGDLLDFTKEYGFDPYPSPRFAAPGSGIRWPEVAAKYEGIVIAPYWWDLRFDERTQWYYTWDCASGCIWDAAAVASIAEIKHPVPFANP